MERVVNVDMEIKSKSVSKAFDRFFKKYPALDYWKEQFEYMAENNIDFFADLIMGDGSKNKDWSYALHLDIYTDHVYMAVVERA